MEKGERKKGYRLFIIKITFFVVSSYLSYDDPCPRKCCVKNDEKFCLLCEGGASFLGNLLFLKEFQRIFFLEDFHKLRNAKKGEGVTGFFTHHIY